MAHQVFTDISIYVNGVELTGDANSFTFTRSQDTPEDSTFGNSFRQRLPGVQDISFALAGLSDYADDANDEDIAGMMGSGSLPLIWAPNSDRGGVCYFGNSVISGYNSGGAYGDAAKFDLSGMISSGEWHRGHLVNPVTDHTATGTTTPVELGAQGAGEVFYGHLQVVDFVGLDDITVLIESAADQAFTTPETRITFAQVTAAGAQIVSSDGTGLTLANEWYRVNISAFSASAGATTSSARLVVGAAIE